MIPGNDGRNQGATAQPISPFVERPSDQAISGAKSQEVDRETQFYG
jgi:hypothetical protein